MASPPSSLQEIPAPRHLPHNPIILHATHDQPLPVSGPPALQVPSFHLHNYAGFSLQKLYQHHHPDHVNTEFLPLYRHSDPMVSMAAVLHTTTCQTSSMPALLHHQHGAAPAMHTPDNTRAKNNSDGLDQVAPALAPSTHPMVSRAAGRFPICRISNPTNRQVTFSKRRNGLLKKAYELSVLCDAEVGVIIFSGTGRLAEFASTSMPKLLERYQEYSVGLPSQKKIIQDIEFWRRQVFHLRDQILHQMELQSYMIGENLLSLDLNDILRIEHKLEIANNKIQAQKAQLIQTKAQESWRQEARLKEENDVLRRKLFEATSLHALKEQMLMRNDDRKVPWLGGDVMRSNLHESSPLIGEDECPSACSTFINQDINNPLKLQLGLELFPSKAAHYTNRSVTVCKPVLQGPA